LKTKEQINRRADFAGYVEEAKRRMFAIGKHLEGNYLVAIPNEKLNAIDLPDRIRKLIEPYYLSVDFSTIDETDLSRFFECE
jgi:hypothetical protein